MNTIAGQFVGGKILFARPPDWPEGTEVVITPSPQGEFRMLTEDEQSDDPEEIEKWIAEQDAIPPFVMDPEDEARMFDGLREMGEYTVRRQIEDPPKCPED